MASEAISQPQCWWKEGDSKKHFTTQLFFTETAALRPDASRMHRKATSSLECFSTAYSEK